MSSENQIASKRTRRAVVTSNKMDKTVIVEVVRRFRHPKYKKFVKRRLRYSAHDAQNDCNIGDVVTIEETRPLSKNKRWKVSQVIERAAII
mgnify:FL=1